MPAIPVSVTAERLLEGAPEGQGLEAVTAQFLDRLGQFRARLAELLVARPMCFLVLSTAVAGQA